MSFLETFLSTAIGLVVALVTQIVVFPWFGFNPPLHDNILITGIFTIVSIVRQFGVRRLFEFLHIRRPLSAFMRAVIAEVYRQQEVEGYDADHDAAHEPGELARAGAAYALFAPSHISENKSRGIFALALSAWPWRKEDWKPYGFRRDMVRAGALIIAEGERFDRDRNQPPNLTTAPLLNTDNKVGLS